MRVHYTELGNAKTNN